MINSKIKQLLSQIDDLKRQISNRPENFILSQNIKERYHTELTYTSNAIEGNTLTRGETSIIINDNLSISGKNIREIYEATNHSKALKYIYTLSESIHINQISQVHIYNIHEIILSNINDNYAGIYRDMPVRISGSLTILPNYAKVPELMNDLDIYLKNTKDHPVMIAIESHYKLVTIHPFVDGNGRTARLLANLILSIAGYQMMIIDPSDRNIYISSLEEAQTTGNTDKYYIFMLSCILDSMNKVLNW